VFPESIGGSFKIDSVCRGCNSELGTKVDAKLVNDFFVKLVRFELNLPSKKGIISLPFEGGQLVGSVADGDAGISVSIRRERASGDVKFSVRPKEYRPYTNSDGIELHRFVDDPADEDRLVSRIQSVCRREGLPILSKDEILKCTKLVKADPNLIECRVKGDTADYKRGITKIAYELACEWLGASYLNDPVGEKLRRFVREANFSIPPQKNAIHGTVKLERIPFQEGPLSHLPYSHMARISYSDEGLVCEVSVFNVIRGYMIVTDNPDAYPLFVPRRIDIDPIRGTHVSRLLQGVVSRSAPAH
jgi:hypothetical protein